MADASKFGDIAKTFGVIAGTLLLPGFGQGYVQAQQRREQARLGEQKQLLGALTKDPTLALNPELQRGLNRVFGPEATKDFVERGKTAQGVQGVTQLLTQFAGGPAPGQFVQAGEAGGETTGLVTPAGFGVVAGEQQLRQPAVPYGSVARGEMERTARVSPEGKVTTTFAPPAAEKQRLMGEERFKQLFPDLVNEQIQAGLDPDSAVINTVNALSFQRGVNVPQEFRQFVGAGPALALQGAQLTQRKKIEREFEETQPMSRADLALLINPQTGQRAQFGLTPAQAREQGYVPVTSPDLSNAEAAQGALDTLMEFRTLADKLFKGVTKGPGGVYARMHQAELYTQSLTDPASDAAQFQAFLGSAPLLIRALGQRGNLTEQEQERGFRLLAGFSFFDTEESKNQKFERLERIFRKARERTRVPTGKRTRTMFVEGVGDVEVEE